LEKLLNNIESDLPAAIDWLVLSRPVGSEVLILPTYTAMNEIREVLSKHTKMEPVS
jgi:hypothetical protein